MTQIFHLPPSVFIVFQSNPKDGSRLRWSSYISSCIYLFVFVIGFCSTPNQTKNYRDLKFDTHTAHNTVG